MEIPFESPEDFDRRATFEKQLYETEADQNEFWSLEKEYSGFISTKEWNPFLIEENGKQGVKSVLVKLYCLQHTMRYY